MTSHSSITVTRANDGKGLMLNPSLRLMATFKVLNEESRSFDYHDYIFDRFPEFQTVANRLLAGSKADAAFADLDIGIIRELESRRIVDLDFPDSDNPSVLALNKNTLLLISVFARYADKPSTRDAITVIENPGAARWLLQAIANSGDLEALGDEDIEVLTKVGALVEQQPPGIVAYPNPELATDIWQQQTAVAEQLYVQRAGESIPVKVQSLLGRQAPELPTTNIVWTCDAGTRVPNATVVPADELDKLVTDKESRLKIDSVKQQRQHWKQALQLAKIGFKKNAYAQLNDVIAPAHQPALRAHVRQLVENHYFGPLDDGQVARRMGLHNEAVTSALHHRLAKLVGLVVGKEVKASYAYLGCYLDGSVLERHIDRPQCQYNLSIVFDMSDEAGNLVDPWPIYLQMGKRPIAINLQPGSGLLYQGTKIEHWRDALPQGQRAIVCFYHFVEPDFAGQLI